MLNKKQINLINDLFENLSEISEEALEDDEFYTWLNNNYFFFFFLEEIVVKLKNVKEKYDF